MKSECLWKLFFNTGDPLAYMLYRAAEEERNTASIA